jgi:hypothetical protein
LTEPHNSSFPTISHPGRQSFDVYHGRAGTSDLGERVIDGNISTIRAVVLLRMAGMIMERRLAQSTRTRRTNPGPNVVWITTSTMAQKRSGRISLNMFDAEYKQGNNKASRTPDLMKSPRKLTPIGYG